MHAKNEMIQASYDSSESAYCPAVFSSHILRFRYPCPMMESLSFYQDRKVATYRCYGNGRKSKWIADNIPQADTLTA